MVEKKYFVKVDDKEFQATFVNNETEISIGDEVFKVEKIKEHAPGVYTFKVNDRIYTFELIEKENGSRQILLDGVTFDIEVLDELLMLLRSFASKDDDEHKGLIKIKAPMPGLVVKLLGEEGAKISKGEKVVIIEAMKMENALVSPINGTIQKIYVKEGQTVEKDAVLVEIVST
ncbi:MAG: hypothetical protein CH6_4405 [Candidatus Kapaibacterium sp.]|nr:MAG: hypothetical protein CH6_4405 [Candidatus Kapabacteria bacterium]